MNADGWSLFVQHPSSYGARHGDEITESRKAKELFVQWKNSRVSSLYLAHDCASVVVLGSVVRVSSLNEHRQDAVPAVGVTK